MSEDAMEKRHAPATQRNREPILAVLREVVPQNARVLEIASGTGEHAVYFARALPTVTWQPTDADEAALRSIEAWRAEADVPNVQPAQVVDAANPPWRVGQVDVVVCINMIHISPWAATQGLMRGAAQVLGRGGRVVLYGPYFVEGQETAPSNLAFDASLRAQNPEWGVRSLEAVLELARGFGLMRERVVTMPSNNLTVVLHKRDGD